MSDSEIEFEAPDDGDMEIVTLEDGQEAPDPAAEAAAAEAAAKPAKVELSAEEYQALLSGKDSTATLAQGLKELGSVLAPRPANVQQPQPETYDAKQFEEDLFVPGKGAAAVQKLLDRTVGQIQGQTAAALQAQSKRILALDPRTKDNYARFEKEIEQKVAELPPQYRGLPDIYERVYQDTIIRNHDVLVKEEADKSVQEKIDAAVEAALKAAGVQPKGGPRPAVYSEANSGTLSAKPKAKLVLTRADVVSMEESMMDPTDKDQVRAYLEDKQRRNSGRK